MGPVVVVALRSEQAALAGLGLDVRRCGMGVERATAWAKRWVAGEEPGRGLVVLGVAGGLAADARAGEVVVATEVRDDRGSVDVPNAARLVESLRRDGRSVTAAPILTRQKLLTGRTARSNLSESGARCLDMESAAIVRGAGAAVPVTVIRVVADTAGTGLLHPATVTNGMRALWIVRRVGRVLGSFGGDR